MYIRAYVKQGQSRRAMRRGENTGHNRRAERVACSVRSAAKKMPFLSVPSNSSGEAHSLLFGLGTEFACRKQQRQFLAFAGADSVVPEGRGYCTYICACKFRHRVLRTFGSDPPRACEA